MGMNEIESCTGCWYAEHGDCSLGNEPCHEKKTDFSELNPMRPEIESEMGMPLESMGSWWYRCPMCHDPLDYRQEECGWCHLKIDWEGQ